VAVLLLPAVLLMSAFSPRPVLAVPVVRLESAPV
jgi:hypothetical protein